MMEDIDIGSVMGTAETIYELVKTLPEEQANLVLVFTQLIQQRSLPVSTALMGKNHERWSNLVAELSGAWPDFPTAEELRASFDQDAVRETL